MKKKKIFPNGSHIFKDFLIGQNHQTSQQVLFPQFRGSPEGRQNFKKIMLPNEFPFIIPNGSFTQDSLVGQNR